MASDFCCGNCLNIVTILKSATSCDITALNFVDACVFLLMSFQEQIVEFVSSCINVKNPADNRIRHCVLLLGEVV